MLIRDLGLIDYHSAWQAMRNFVDQAKDQAEQPQEIWLAEHPPVYTLGQSGKREHILNPGAIPIIPIDRGGQVTYHGPGQLLVYLLLNLRAWQLGVKEYVRRIEQGVIDFLASLNIQAERRVGAPGVYVDGAKIASLGLRIRHGWSYHGLSFNVDMDLSPFLGINPCGMKGLTMTQLTHLNASYDINRVKNELVPRLLSSLGNPHDEQHP